MKLIIDIIIVASIAIPLAMFYGQRRIHRIRLVFNVLALAALLVFGNIASASIVQIIIDQTVFMTEIHGVFLNPYFLTTGAYLGLFLTYRLIIIIMDE